MTRKRDPAKPKDAAEKAALHEATLARDRENAMVRLVERRPEFAQQVLNAVERDRARPVRVELKEATPGAKGSRLEVAGDTYEEFIGAKAILLDQLGSSSESWRSTVLSDLTRLSRSGAATEMSAALALVAAVGPQDELEGALAVQIVGTHLLAVRAIASAQHAEHLPQYEAHAAVATKASRTFAAQLEALAKLRGKSGRQTIIVEHRTQYIAPGGQGVIGDVTAGGGPSHQTSTQSHGQVLNDGILHAIAHAPGAPVPPLWCENAGGNAVPRAQGHGAEAVPDARGICRGSQRADERSLEGRSLHEGGEGSSASASGSSESLGRPESAALKDKAQ